MTGRGFLLLVVVLVTTTTVGVPIDGAALQIADPSSTQERTVSSERGEVELRAPTAVEAGEPYEIDGTIRESRPEEYGTFVVYIDGERVASAELSAGESVRFSEEFTGPQTSRTHVVEVRFVNDAIDLDEFVGRTELVIEPRGDVSSDGDGESTSGTGDAGAAAGDGTDGDGGSGGQAQDTAAEPRRSAQVGGRVLLDGSVESIGSVTVDGQSYDVYRYENLIPYASGIEVYSRGERVTSESTVRRVMSVLAARSVLQTEGVERPRERAADVTDAGTAEGTFRVVAWQAAAGELDRSDLETLRRTEQRAGEIRQVVTPPLNALDAALGLIDRLKGITVGGVSAWDVATQASPTLGQFESVARDLRGELQAWRDDAAAVETSVSSVTDSVERIRDDRPVDYAELADQFETASSAMARLEERSGGVADRLSSVADTSSTIAREGSSAPVVGGQIRDTFGGVANTLDRSAGQIRDFEGSLERQRRELTAVRETALSERRRLVASWEEERANRVASWRARRDAATRVYGTIGGVSVGGLAAMGLLLRRFGVLF